MHLVLPLPPPPRFSRTKISPKRKFSVRISRGHPGVIRADIPTQNFGQGDQIPGKTSISARTSMAPKARTSTPLRGFQKLWSEKLWAEFSFPRFTRCTTTLNPKAGLGLQRQSARRQPVVQARILVVQGLLCGNSSEKVPY